MTATAFVPENPLEAALVEMAKNPEAGAVFDRLLLESPLHVIGESKSKGTDTVSVQNGAQVQLIAVRRGDVQYIPAFTSPARLAIFFENATKSALIRHYLTMDGRALFAMAGGAHFLLNPGFPYGLRMPAEAVARLLQTNPMRPQ
ncbi:MAG TPA: SseB family protein [Rhizomicrobium sp.]|nr:SseB family protein [Rhizomicrobium sp.]